MIRARCKIMRAERGVDLLDEGREFGGLIRRARSGFRAPPRERGRRGQRETRIRDDGDESVMRSGIKPEFSQ